MDISHSVCIKYKIKFFLRNRNNFYTRQAFTSSQTSGDLSICHNDNNFCHFIQHKGYNIYLSGLPFATYTTSQIGNNICHYPRHNICHITQWWYHLPSQCCYHSHHVHKLQDTPTLIHHKVLEFIKLKIFLRPEEAMFECWQKLFFYWTLFLFLRKSLILYKTTYVSFSQEVWTSKYVHICYPDLYVHPQNTFAF